MRFRPPGQLWAYQVPSKWQVFLVAYTWEARACTAQTRQTALRYKGRSERSWACFLETSHASLRLYTSSISWETCPCMRAGPLAPEAEGGSWLFQMETLSSGRWTQQCLQLEATHSTRSSHSPWPAHTWRRSWRKANGGGTVERCDRWSGRYESYRVGREISHRDAPGRRKSWD